MFWGTASPRPSWDAGRARHIKPNSTITLPLRPLKARCRLASGGVPIGVVFAVGAIVVVTVTHIFFDLVQHDSNHVGAQPCQSRDDRSDGFAAGLARFRNYDYAVGSCRHLEWLGETQQGRRVDDDQVVFRRRL